MADYQQRVIDEKAELDVKIEALEHFIESREFGSLDSAEKERLLRQAVIMEEYSTVLSARIDAFDDS